MFGKKKASIANQGKTNAEIYAESPKDLAEILDASPDKNKSGAVTVEASSQNLNERVLLNADEAKSILGENVTPEDDRQDKKEAKVKRKDADEGRFCNLFPCMKCSMANHGIMKGLRRSIPKKQHIIQYWRKQLTNRINMRKHAIVVDGNTDLNISYRELDEFSNSIAYNLKELKFSQPFDNFNPNGEIVIAVCHPACYEYVVILLAVLKLGASILPISVDLPAERIAEIVKLTRPVLLIASPQEDDLFDDLLTMVDVDVMYVDEIWNMLVRKGDLDKSLLAFNSPIQSPDPRKPYPPMWKRTVVISIVPSDEYEIQALSYDSRAIFNRIKWEDHFFVYFSSEYVLVPPSFENVDSIADVLTALVIGVTLVAYQCSTDVFIPEQLFSYCQTYKIRRLILWPSLLKACLTAMQLFDFYAQQVRTVRYWFCIGGSMRSELSEIFFELLHPLAQLVHMYHFEDCTGAVSFQNYETVVNTKEHNLFARLSVGYPVPNMDIYVLDSRLKPVKDGELGEIYVSGVQLPRVSMDKLPSKNYMTNLFSKNKDRKFMVRTLDFGRIKTKSNGTRVLMHEMTHSRHFYVEDQVVWLQNIERYSMRVTHLVKNCHAVCYRPNEDDQLILAFCVPVSSEVTATAVENELRNILSLHTVPEVILVDEISAFPETGLPDENALLRQYQEQRLERQYFDDWDVLGIKDQFVLRAAKILCYVIYTFIGVPIRFLVEQCWKAPYLAIRRATVTKAAFIVKELHRNRYPVYIDDFVYAESLSMIAENMIEARKDRGFCNRNCPADEVSFNKNRYKLEIMVNSHRTSVCSLLAKCFTQRGQLDYYAEVSYGALRKYFDTTWPIFVAKKLSVVIRRKKERNKMVGAVLNINWHDELELTSSVVPKEIAYKLELIHYLETALNDSHFPQDKTHVIQVCYIGLNAATLNDTEIHGLTDKIIRSLLAFGKVKGFEAIVVITYDFFSLDICVNNYGFHVARQVQANQFVASDGVQPYTLCPDSLVASICWKLFSKVTEDIHHHRKTSDKMMTKMVGLFNDHKKPWSN